MHLRVLLALASLCLLSGCGTYSYSSVAKAPNATTTPGATAPAAKTPADILLTENDITDRKYRSLGDIKVTVNKVTIFDKDPTVEQVGDALREKAAEMGADAVVLARYGTVGIGFSSWGVREGAGRAVVFEQ